MLDTDTLIIRKLLQPLLVDLALGQSILIMSAVFYAVIPIHLIFFIFKHFLQNFVLSTLEEKKKYSER